MPIVLGIDPGSCKCGYAVVSLNANEDSPKTACRVPVSGIPAPAAESLSPKIELIEKGIVKLEDLSKILTRLAELNPELIVLGDGTNVKKIQETIEKIFPNIPVEIEKERDTTLKARERYFKEHPPKGIWKLVPISLQTPSDPIDDYAALLIVEEYLRNRTESCE